MNETKTAMEPNMDEVICPKCCHQFRAIPWNVQRELADAQAAKLAESERDLDAMKTILNAVIYIPQMSDEQLEQFRRSAADAARGVKS